MPGLTGPIAATGGDIFSSSTAQQHQLGTVAQTRDGRRFRYCKAGGTLVVGNLIQAPAKIDLHQDLVPTLTTYTGAVGTTQIALTLGATAAAANLYAEGWAYVSVTAGLGYAYSISSHPVAVGSDLIVFTFQSDSKIQVAFDANTRVGLQINPYKNVIQSPTSAATGAQVGVAVYPIPSGEYGWIQVSGPGFVLIAGTPAVGNAVSWSNTAGAVAINSGTLSVLGTMMVTGQSGLVEPVMLTIS